MAVALRCCRSSTIVFSKGRGLSAADQVPPTRSQNPLSVCLVVARLRDALVRQGPPSALIEEEQRSS